MVLKMVMMVMMITMTRYTVSWGDARRTSTSPFWRRTTPETTATTSTTAAATTTATGQCYNVATGEN